MPRVLAAPYLPTLELNSSPSVFFPVREGLWALQVNQDGRADVLQGQQLVVYMPRKQRQRSLKGLDQTAATLSEAAAMSMSVHKTPDAPNTLSRGHTEF